MATMGAQNIKIGEQYIELNGKAVPIRGLVGALQGNFFYLNNGATGYHVRTREMSGRERHQQLVAQAIAGQAAISADCGLDISDWK